MIDVLDNAPCGFVTVANDGLVHRVNATLLKLLGSEREEVVGQPFYQLLVSGSRIFYQTHLFPLLKMSVPKWAVISRVLWHLGFAPGIENAKAARQRAEAAAQALIARARQDGTVALVAHGYFNFLIGRVLARRGFRRSGSHRARYWNTVIYERQHGEKQDG